MWRKTRMHTAGSWHELRGLGGNQIPHYTLCDLCTPGAAIAFVLKAPYLGRSVRITVLATWKQATPVTRRRDIRDPDHSVLPHLASPSASGRESDADDHKGRSVAVCPTEIDDMRRTGAAVLNGQSTVSYCPLRRSLILATESLTSEKTAVVPSPVGD